MAHGKREREDEEAEITARPKRTGDDLVSRVVEESGLAVSPDDLGRQFLADATEQGNFESSLGGDTPEISVTGAPPSDDPPPGNEADKSIWTRTVDETLESGGVDELEREASPAGTEQNQGIESASDEQLVLIEDDVDEASLLDDEADELGEVTEPEPLTDDSGRRMQRTARRRHRPRSI